MHPEESIVVYAVEGEIVTLEVPVTDGENYEWSRTDGAIDSRWASSTDGVRATLTTQSATLADSGEYILHGSAGPRKRMRLEVRGRTPADADSSSPFFLRRLTDLAVKVGSRTRLIVEIQSDSELQVTWYRNARRLQPSTAVNMTNEGRFHCLELSATTPEDSGRWTCAAANKTGRAECSAHLNVIVPKAYKRPEFLEELRALLTDQGTVSLECKVIGVPTPTLRWFKDSEEIRAGDVFALTANPEDATSLGIYTCEASNCMGKAYSSSKVHVVGRGSREGSLKPADSVISSEPPPIFISELKEQRVKIGEPIELSCRVSVPPWPKSVVWYNKNGRADPNECISLEDGAGGLKLSIPSVTWDHEGEWKCVASSAGGRLSASTCYVNVDVPKNYRKPRFMENLKAVLTEEGLVSFECKVVGFPTPQLSWFKDGLELKPGDVYQLTGSNSLGSYCCIAKNCMGQASSQAELTVEDIQNQLDDEERMQLFSENKAPKFVQVLKSQEAKINEDFRFTVKVSISPEPTLTWYRDDQPIDESPRYKILKESKGIYHLDIKQLEITDQAEWKCVATNEFGHSVTSCFLKLVIPRHFKKPRFLENLRAILSEEGAVNLECKVIGVPQPVLKWYKDGEELKPGDIHRIISGQDGTCCLGTYTCEAQNCMGIAASSASLLGFEDTMKAGKTPKAEPEPLQRNISLSTIHEERTSQLYDTPVGDITLDEKGEISFSFSGKEVSVSLYETPDLTEEEALQIVEMYADQLSEHITEQNVVELPPLRFVKETSTSGNLLMEAIVIDVSPDYFVSPEDDLRTEADMEDISIIEEIGVPTFPVEVTEVPVLYHNIEELPERPPRKKSESIKSGDDFYSFSKDKSESEKRKITEVNSESEQQSFETANSMNKLSETNKQSSERITDKSPKTKKRRKESTGSRRSSSGSEKSLDSDFITPLTPKVLTDMTKRLTTVLKICKVVQSQLNAVEDEVILQSAQMSSAATAKKSLEVIDSLKTPLLNVQKISNILKEDCIYGDKVIPIFQSYTPPLKTLHQNLAIIEKCIEIEGAGRTLVQRTSVCLVETLAKPIQSIFLILKDLCSTLQSHHSSKNMKEMHLILEDTINSLLLSEESIKSTNLIKEASEIQKPIETLEKHELNENVNIIQNVWKPILKLQKSLESVKQNICIEQDINMQEYVMELITKPIQELQNALETIEDGAVKESNEKLYDINSVILQGIVDPMVALRNDLDSLKNEMSPILVENTLDNLMNSIHNIKSNLIHIGEQFNIKDIEPFEENQRMIQKVARNLLVLQSNLELLTNNEKCVALSNKFDKLQTNLAKLLEAALHLTPFESLGVLKNIAEPSEKLNENFELLKSDKIEEFVSAAICSIDTLKENISFIDVSDHADINNCLKSSVTSIEELKVSMSHETQDVKERMGEAVKENIKCIDDITNTIKHHIMLATESQQQQPLESLKDFSNLENISQLTKLANILVEIRDQIGSSQVKILENPESPASLAEIAVTEELAQPLNELNCSLNVATQQILDDYESMHTSKNDISALKVLIKPLQEFHENLTMIQHNVQLEYGERLDDFVAESTLAKSMRELDSCLLEIQQQYVMEVADDISTLQDISGIKSVAELKHSVEVAPMKTIETPLESVAYIPQISQNQTMQLLYQSLNNLQKIFSIEEVEKYTFSPLKSFIKCVTTLKNTLEKCNILDKDINEEVIPEYTEVISSLENLQKLVNDITSVNSKEVIPEEGMDEETFKQLNVITDSVLELQQNIRLVNDSILHQYGSEKVIEKLSSQRENLAITVEPTPYEHLEDISTATDISALKSLAAPLQDLKHAIGAIQEQSGIWETNEDFSDTTKPQRKEQLIVSLQEVLDGIATVQNILTTEVAKSLSENNIVTNEINEVAKPLRDLSQKIIAVQENLISHPHDTEESLKELSYNSTIAEALVTVERCYAVLQQHDLLDLTHASDICLQGENEEFADFNVEQNIIAKNTVIENTLAVFTDIQNISSINQHIGNVGERLNSMKRNITNIQQMLRQPLAHIIKERNEINSYATAAEKQLNEFEVEVLSSKINDNEKESVKEYIGLVRKNLSKINDTLSIIYNFNKQKEIINPLKILKQFSRTVSGIPISIARQLPILETIIAPIQEICHQFELADLNSNCSKPGDVTVKSNDISEAVKIMLNYIQNSPAIEEDNLGISQHLEELKFILEKHGENIVGKNETVCGSFLKDLAQPLGRLSNSISTSLNEPISEVPTVKSVISNLAEPVKKVQECLSALQKQFICNSDDDTLTADISLNESYAEPFTEMQKELTNFEESVIFDTQTSPELKIAQMNQIEKSLNSFQENINIMEQACASTEEQHCIELLKNSINEMENKMHVIESSIIASNNNVDGTKKETKINETFIVEKLADIISCGNLEEYVKPLKELSQVITSIHENDFYKMGEEVESWKNILESVVQVEKIIDDAQIKTEKGKIPLNSQVETLKDDFMEVVLPLENISKFISELKEITPTNDLVLNKQIAIMEKAVTVMDQSLKDLSLKNLEEISKDDIQVKENINLTLKQNECVFDEKREMLKHNIISFLDTSPKSLVIIAEPLKALKAILSIVADASNENSIENITISEINNASDLAEKIINSEVVNTQDVNEIGSLLADISLNASGIVKIDEVLEHISKNETIIPESSKNTFVAAVETIDSYIHSKPEIKFIDLKVAHNIVENLHTSIAKNISSTEESEINIDELVDCVKTMEGCNTVESVELKPEIITSINTILGQLSKCPPKVTQSKVNVEEICEILVILKKNIQNMSDEQNTFQLNDNYTTIDEKCFNTNDDIQKTVLISEINTLVDPIKELKSIIVETENEQSVAGVSCNEKKSSYLHEILQSVEEFIIESENESVNPLKLAQLSKNINDVKEMIINDSLKEILTEENFVSTATLIDVFDSVGTQIDNVLNVESDTKQQALDKCIGKELIEQESSTHDAEAVLMEMIQISDRNDGEIISSHTISEIKDSFIKAKVLFDKPLAEIVINRKKLIKSIDATMKLIENFENIELNQSFRNENLKSSLQNSVGVIKNSLSRMLGTIKKLNVYCRQSNFVRPLKDINKFIRVTEELTSKENISPNLCLISTMKIPVSFICDRFREIDERISNSEKSDDINVSMTAIRPPVEKMSSFISNLSANINQDIQQDRDISIPVLDLQKILQTALNDNSSYLNCDFLKSLSSPINQLTSIIIGELKKNQNISNNMKNESSLNDTKQAEETRTLKTIEDKFSTSAEEKNIDNTLYEISETTIKLSMSVDESEITNKEAEDEAVIKLKKSNEFCSTETTVKGVQSIQEGTYEEEVDHLNLSEVNDKEPTDSTNVENLDANISKSKNELIKSETEQSTHIDVEENKKDDEVLVLEENVEKISEKANLSQKSSVEENKTPPETENRSLATKDDDKSYDDKGNNLDGQNNKTENEMDKGKKNEEGKLAIEINNEMLRAEDGENKNITSENMIDLKTAEIDNKQMLTEETNIKLEEDSTVRTEEGRKEDNMKIIQVEEKLITEKEDLDIHELKTKDFAPEEEEGLSNIENDTPGQNAEAIEKEAKDKEVNKKTSDEILLPQSEAKWEESEDNEGMKKEEKFDLKETEGKDSKNKIADLKIQQGQSNITEDEAGIKIALEDTMKQDLVGEEKTDKVKEDEEEVVKAKDDDGKKQQTELKNIQVEEKESEKETTEDKLKKDSEGNKSEKEGTKTQDDTEKIKQEADAIDKEAERADTTAAEKKIKQEDVPNKSDKNEKHKVEAEEKKNKDDEEEAHKNNADAQIVKGEKKDTEDPNKTYADEKHKVEPEEMTGAEEVAKKKAAEEILKQEANTEKKKDDEKESKKKTAAIKMNSEEETTKKAEEDYLGEEAEAKKREIEENQNKAATDKLKQEKENKMKEEETVSDQLKEKAAAKKKKEEEEEDKKKSAEDSLKQEEEAKKKEAEEAKKEAADKKMKEEEAAKKIAADDKLKEESAANKKKDEDDEAKKKAHVDKLKQEEETEKKEAEEAKKKTAEEEAAKNKASEEKLKQEEEAKNKDSEQAKKKAAEEEAAKKKAAEDEMKQEEEAKKNQEEEAKKKAVEEKAAKTKAAEEEASKKKAAEDKVKEEASKKKAAEDKVKEEDAAKKKAAEDKLKQEEEEKKMEAEEAKKKAAEEEASKKKAAEDKVKEKEAAKKKAAEDKLKQEEEAKKKEAEEAKKKAAEEEAAKKKAAEEEVAKKRAAEEEEAKKKAAEDKLKEKEAAKKKAEEDKLKQEEEAKKKQEEEGKKKAAEEDASKKKAAEEEVAKKKAAEEEAAKKKAAEEEVAKKRAAEEEEAKKKAADDKLKEEEAAKKKADEDKLKQEEEAKKKQEEEGKKKAAEEEAFKKKAAEEEVAKRRAAEEEEAKKKAAEDKLKEGEAAKKKAAEDKLKQEEEAKKKEAEEAKKKAAEEEASKKKASEEEVAKKRAAEEEEAKKKAAEEKLKEEEAAKKKAAEDKLKQEEEEKKMETEEAKKKAAEEEAAKKKAAEVEAAKKKAAEDKLKQEEEAKKKEAEEAKKKAAEEEAAKKKAAEDKLKEEEAAKKKATEDNLKQEEEAKKKQEEEAKIKAVEEEAAKKKAAEDKLKEEEAAKKKAAEDKLKQEEEAKKKQEEEAKIKAVEEEAAKKKAAEDKLKEEEAAKKKAAEDKLKQEEEAKKKQEEEAKKKALEEAAKKKAAEDKLKQEEEAKKKQEKEAKKKATEEAAKKKAAEDKLKEEEAAKKKAAEDNLKQEEEAKKKQVEEAKIKAVEEEAAKKKAAEDKLKQEEEAKKKEAEEAKKKAAEEEAAKKKAAEDKLKQEEEAKKKEAEEAKKKAAEEEAAKKKAAEDKLKEEEAAKKKAAEDKLKEDEAAKKKAAEDKLKQEEEAKKKQEEEAKKKSLEEEAAKKKAAEDKLKQEEEAKKKQEKEAKKKATEEAAKKKAAEDKLKEEEAAKKKAAEDKLKQEEEAKKKQAEEAKMKAAEEEAAKKKAAEDKLKQEEEAKKKQEIEAKKKAAEEEAAKKKAAEDKLKEEEAAKKKAAEDKLKQEEEAKKKQEEEAKKKSLEEEEAKKKAAVDKLKQGEEAKKKEAEEARNKATEEAAKKKAAEDKLKQEEAVKKKEVEEANKKAAEEEAANKKASEDKVKQEEEAKKIALEEETAKKKAAEDKLKEEEAANKKAAEDKLKQEEEAKRKEAEEAKKKAADEEAAKKKAAENKLKEEKVAKKKAAEDKLKEEEAAKKKAAEDKQKVEASVKKKKDEEVEAKKKADEDKLNQESESKKKVAKEKEVKKKTAEDKLKQEGEVKKKESDVENNLIQKSATTMKGAMNEECMMIEAASEKLCLDVDSKKIQSERKETTRQVTDENLKQKTEAMKKDEEESTRISDKENHITVFKSNVKKLGIIDELSDEKFSNRQSLNIDDYKKTDSSFKRSDRSIHSSSETPSASLLQTPRSKTPGPRDSKKKPIFSTRLTDRTAVEGSRVKLTCSVLGTPEPNVQWFRNGVLLTDKNKYLMKYIDGLATLEVLNAEPKDSADYTCTAINENGTVSCSAGLKVYAGVETTPIPPTFTRSIKDTYHVTEDELVLECRIRGQPRPVITWFKNGKNLSTESRYQMNYLADGVCRLIINRPDPSDSATYTCKAQNPLWSDEISHHVQFAGRDLHLAASPHRFETVRSVRSGHESRRPYFSRVLSDHAVPIGGTIALQVEVGGGVAEVEWRRGGVPLPRSLKFKEFTERGVHTLAVENASIDESGIYTCTVKNEHGSVDTTANVSVLPPGSLRSGKAATIVSRPEADLSVTEGEDFSISLRAQGDPKPKVVWLKGLRDITNSWRSLKENSDDYFRFTLKRTLMSDAGTYCIMAKNCYGTDRTFVTLFVRQRLDSDSFDFDKSESNYSDLSNIRDVPQAISGEPEVSDGGKDWVSLRWSKPPKGPQAPVLAYRVDAWLQGSEGGARWQSLGLTPVNGFDAFKLTPGAYLFRVTPRNRYGWGPSIQTKEPISVGGTLRLPEFTTPLPGQVKVLIGESTTLSCAVAGSPTPTVVWYKDGQEIDGAVISSSGRCVLHIANVEQHHEGRYTCEATGPEGRAATFARLSVVNDKKIYEADENFKKYMESETVECAPVFSMRLRDRRVQATYPVRLTCRVEGRPAPLVTWTKDDEIIEANDHFSFWASERFHTLEISSTTLEDAGRYSAHAANPLGAVRCSAILTVDKGLRAYLAPDFVLAPDTLYRISEGSELRIRAVVEAYPSVGVSWHRDGLRLRPSRRALFTLDRDGEVEMALAHVTQRDSGIYTVTASNEVGKAACSTRVEVIAPHEEGYFKDETPMLLTPSRPYSKEPIFIKKPRSSEAKEGDTVVILCEVQGDPKPEVLWLRDWLKPEYYRDATQFRRVGAGPEYRLEIPHCKLDHTGAYTVIASNCHGQTKAIISLQIYAKGPDEMDHGTITTGRVHILPRIIRELKDMRCCDGDAVTFECMVEGTPSPLVQWEKDGQLIHETEDFRMNLDGDVAHLTICCVYPEDEGVYTCTAYNELGKVYTSSCLIVDVPEEKENLLSQQLTRPPMLLSAGSTPRSTPRSTPCRSMSPQPHHRVLRQRDSMSQTPSRTSRWKLAPPKFFAVPFNRVAEEGENISFRCCIAGHPVPKVYWDKDGSEIQLNPRISIREKDDDRVLTINNVKFEDSGVYRVTLENEAGRAEATACLDVINLKGHSPLTRVTENPRTSPYVRRHLNGSHYRVGERLRLSSEIRGSPSPTSKWYRNGLQLQMSDRIFEVKEGDTCTLIINSLERSDCGVYTLIGTNELGNASSWTKISIENKIINGNMKCIGEHQPHILQELKDVSVEEGKAVEIQMKVENCCVFSFTWIRNNTALPDSDIYRYVDYGNGVIGLRLEDIYEQDQGVYTCIVRNVFGSAKSTCNVKVTENTTGIAFNGFKKYPEPVIVEEDGDAVFNLTVDPKSKFNNPKAMWQIAGNVITESSTKYKLTNDSSMFTLQISKVQGFESGFIRCAIRTSISDENINESESLWFTTQLCVVPAAFLNKKSNSSPSKMQIKPRFTSKIENVIVPIGGKAIFNASFCGFPAPTVTWFMLDRVISPCKRLNITNTLTNTALEICDAEIGDSAVYKVIIENAQGIDSMTALLQVENTEVSHKPAQLYHIDDGMLFDMQYSIHNVIGRGHFGSVKLIKNKKSGEQLAAKFVKISKQKDKEVIMSELEILHCLKHPKLIQLVDAFMKTNQMIIITEYISGGQLFERVSEDDFTLTERDCILFMTQILEGVAFMHSKNIVHLDLKPENIMCHTRPSHEIKIIDFGLAKRLKPNEDFRTLCGTAEFIAPEVVNFDPISTASDMWSIGVICYILLSGLSPFAGDTVQETYSNILRVRYDFDDEAFDKISEEAKEFIRELLVKPMDKRPSAAKCLQNKWMMKHQGTSSRTALSTEKLRKFVIQSKWQMTGNAIRAVGRMASLCAISRMNTSRLRNKTENPKPSKEEPVDVEKIN